MDARLKTPDYKLWGQAPGAGYWKIDVSSTNGNVVLAGYIHDKKAEERIVAKIRQIKGVKSVKSDLKVEVKK